MLPGSANSIGGEFSKVSEEIVLSLVTDFPKPCDSAGQAFTIKLRPTKANTPDSLVIEMPWDVRLPSGERKPKGEKPRWRRMKMACGEVRPPLALLLDLLFELTPSIESCRTSNEFTTKFEWTIPGTSALHSILPVNSNTNKTLSAAKLSMYIRRVKL